jgi:DNA-binding transcriptional regulator YhcF (GntR family)
MEILMVSFHLDKKVPSTYYEQIREQLVLHLLSSNLKAGEKLPTIRQTARMLDISPDAVFKIYRRLRNEDLVHIRQGSGVYAHRAYDGTSQYSQALARFIAGILHQAEVRFSLPPRMFNNLMSTYISKGSVHDLYLVINDDETKDIDTHFLQAHFRCRFVSMDVAAFENPSSRTQELVRSASGCITTRYHLERVRILLRRFKPRILEIQRDPRFVTDVVSAAHVQQALVVFERRVTCDHFCELVLKKLYPSRIHNLSFAAIEDLQLQDEMTKASAIFSSPLCYEAVRRLAPRQTSVVQIQGWISSQSLEELRAALLNPQKSVAVSSPPPEENRPRTSNKTSFL